MSMSITKLAGALGAEIRDVDLGSLDDATFAAIHQALLDHGVICIRDQDIAPDQQLAFARRWGEVHLHPYLAGLPERPEIIEIVRAPEDAHGFGDHWHTDQIFTPKPAMATMLYAKEVPAVGGDTLFADLYSAYETLSDGMKAMLAPLRTWNIYTKTINRSAAMDRKVQDKEKPAEPAVHPVIRRHPETGRPALYICYANTTRHFEGMTEAESRPLLDWLLAHATRPEFTCRIRWEPGTLTIWDNRRTLHMALNDPLPSRRVMHRITIKGEATEAWTDAA